MNEPKRIRTLQTYLGSRKLGTAINIGPLDTYTWELDKFAGQLSGFWMAEAELTSEKQKIEYPKFITEEVTDDEEYRNSRLSLI